MRIITLLLVFLLCLVTFNGCGQPGDGYFNSEEWAAVDYRARYEAAFWNNIVETNRGGMNVQPLPLN